MATAGRPPEVEHTKERLLRKIGSAYGLVTAILALPVQVNPNGPAGLHPKHARQIVELAFMAMVAAWEEFLEQVLVRYVAGAATANGYRPTPKYGLANSIQHAYELVSQDSRYDPLKDYLKVTDPKWVRQRADFFFAVHPFGALQAKTDLLKHATSIRNRVAHESDKCKRDFKESAIYFLQPPNDTLTRGYGPGDLLMARVQRHFGQGAVQQGLAHFVAYRDMFEQLAVAIVP
jgi:hypothetical protein